MCQFDERPHFGRHEPRTGEHRIDRYLGWRPTLQHLLKLPLGHQRLGNQVRQQGHTQACRRRVAHRKAVAGSVPGRRQCHPTGLALPRKRPRGGRRAGRKHQQFMAGQLRRQTRLTPLLEVVRRRIQRIAQAAQPPGREGGAGRCPTRIAKSKPSCTTSTMRPVISASTFICG